MKHRPPPLAPLIITTSLAALLLMTAFETGKQFLLPHLTLWQSHTITIAFSTVIAFVAAYLVGTRLNATNLALADANRSTKAAGQAIQESLDALGHSEERYRGFFESDLTANYVSSPDGQVLGCNAAYARLFGYSCIEEAMEHNLGSLYAQPDGRETFLQPLRTQRRLDGFTEELRRKDGQSLYVRLSAIGVFDASGELTEIRGYIIDETDRRKVEGQLRQAQKMEAVGRLAGGVAHDFNNMLNVILGFAELARQRIPTSDPLHEEIVEIQRAGERVAGMTRQLLAFSRQQVLQPRVLNLNARITETVKMLSRLIGEDILLATMLEKDLGSVMADAGQIDQVILNLAVNARDAMPHGGRMVIETRNVELGEEYAKSHSPVLPGKYVMLAVSDSGIGMDRDTQEHVFEPFFTTKEKNKGTGLGLATVYGIVQQSGGHIWVYSEPGQGATFKVYLPRVAGAPEVAVVTEKPLTAESGSETVLLVEDEDLVRRLSRHVLESKGYTVLDACDGATALQVAKEFGQPIHLLLTDVVMPGMNGRELAGKLASSHPETRVLYTSGYADGAIVHNGVLEAGVAFLPKPHSVDALAAKVREVLDA